MSRRRQRKQHNLIDIQSCAEYSPSRRRMRDLQSEVFGEYLIDPKTCQFP